MIVQIEPQEGFQTAFLSSPADILIGGGAAGAGKSYALLLDPTRYLQESGFGAVIFRRITPQITNEGALWDTASELYPLIGGQSKEYKLLWEFPTEAGKTSRIRFHHLENEKNKHDHQGGQYPYIGFDELTQFTKTQFLYLLSRNRTGIANVKPCIRATCNPDPDSWVADFLEWWIDQQTGFPIPERAGVLRYMVNDAGIVVWGDSFQEVVDRCPHIFNNPELKDIDPKTLIKSVTFIPGSIYHNKRLLKNNPEYLSNLLALPEEEQMRLLKGNWKIRQDGSSIFDFVKVNDLFSNFLEADPSNPKYITVDYARQGQDFTVIMTWLGWRVIRIEVMTKSSTVEAFDAIEKERERSKIPRSHVIVDEDGVGGGVVDLSHGEYIGFHANSTPFDNLITGIKDNYRNLKTQCYYKLGEKVNHNEIAINLTNLIVDSQYSVEVKTRERVITIEKMIKEDLRAMKRKNIDRDNKLQMNTKEEQKIILGGRSPDFGDALSMRMYFELKSSTISSSNISFV